MCCLENAVIVMIAILTCALTAKASFVRIHSNEPDEYEPEKKVSLEKARQFETSDSIDFIGKVTKRHLRTSDQRKNDDKRSQVLRCVSVGPNEMDCKIRGRHESLKFLYEDRTSHKHGRHFKQGHVRTNTPRNSGKHEKRKKNSKPDRKKLKALSNHSSTLDIAHEDIEKTFRKNPERGTSPKMHFMNLFASPQVPNPPIDPTQNSLLNRTLDDYLNQSQQSNMFPDTNTSDINMPKLHNISNWLVNSSSKASASQNNIFSTYNDFSPRAGRLHPTVHATVVNFERSNAKRNLSANGKHESATALAEKIVEELRSLPSELRRKVYMEMLGSSSLNIDNSLVNELDKSKHLSKSASATKSLFTAEPAKSLAAPRLPEQSCMDYEPQSGPGFSLNPFDISNIVMNLQVRLNTNCRRKQLRKHKTRNKKKTASSNNSSDSLKFIHAELAKKRLNYLERQSAVTLQQKDEENVTYLPHVQTDDTVRKVRESLHQKRKELDRQLVASSRGSASTWDSGMSHVDHENVPWVYLNEQQAVPQNTHEVDELKVDAAPHLNRSPDSHSLHFQDPASSDTNYTRLGSQVSVSGPTPSLGEFADAVKTLMYTGRDVYPESGESGQSKTPGESPLSRKPISHPRSRPFELSISETSSPLHGTIPYWITSTQQSDVPTLSLSEPSTVSSARGSKAALESSMASVVSTPNPVRMSQVMWYDDKVLAELLGRTYDDNSALDTSFPKKESTNNTTFSMVLDEVRGLSELLHSTARISYLASSTNSVGKSPDKLNAFTSFIMPTTATSRVAILEALSRSQPSPLVSSTEVADFKMAARQAAVRAEESQPFEGNRTYGPTAHVYEKYGRNFELELVLLQEFKSSLTERGSHDFALLKKDLENKISSIYANDSSYLSCRVKSFAPYNQSASTKLKLQIFFSQRSIDHFDLLEKKILSGAIKINASHLLPHINITRLHDYVNYQTWCDPPCRQPYKCYPDCQADCCVEVRSYEMKSPLQRPPNKAVVGVVLPLENASWLRVLQNIPYAVYSYLLPAKLPPTSSWKGSSETASNVNARRGMCGPLCNEVCSPYCTYECCAEYG